MGRKLLLFGKTSLLMKKTSVLISLVLVILTFGIIFLKTLTMDDLNVVQKIATNTTETNAGQIHYAAKVIGDSGSNDKKIANYSNNHFQNNTIHGKELSYCYFISESHWSDNDDGHSDEEDSDVCDEEDRENEYDREDA